MKIEYYKSIGIQQYKNDYLVLFNRFQFGEKSLFETLNLPYLETCEIIEKLKLHINHKSGLVEDFEINSHISTFWFTGNSVTVSDDLWGKPDVYVDTETILELMLERKLFMSLWTREKLLSELEIMFHKLTESKDSFRSNSYSIHYKVPSTDAEIFFDVYNFDHEKSVKSSDLLSFIKIHEECFNFPDYLK